MRRKFDFGKGSYKNKYYEKGVRSWERCSNRESKFYHEKEDGLWLWQEESSTMTKKVYYEKRGSIMDKEVLLWEESMIMEKKVLWWEENSVMITMIYYEKEVRFWKNKL